MISRERHLGARARELRRGGSGLRSARHRRDIVCAMGIGGATWVADLDARTHPLGPHRLRGADPRDRARHRRGLLHAGWNVLLRRRRHPLDASGCRRSDRDTAPIGIAPWLANGRLRTLQSDRLALVSGVWRRSTSSACRRRTAAAPVARVPAGRGSAPLLAVAIGILLLGRELLPWPSRASAAAPWHPAGRAAWGALQAAGRGTVARSASRSPPGIHRAYSAWIDSASGSRSPGSTAPSSPCLRRVPGLTVVVGRRVGLLARLRRLPRRPLPADHGARAAGWPRRGGGRARAHAYLLVLAAYSIAPRRRWPAARSGDVLAAAWGALRLARRSVAAGADAIPRGAGGRGGGPAAWALARGVRHGGATAPDPTLAVAAVDHATPPRMSPSRRRRRHRSSRQHQRAVTIPRPQQVRELDVAVAPIRVRSRNISRYANRPEQASHRRPRAHRDSRNRERVPKTRART